MPSRTRFQVEADERDEEQRESINLWGDQWEELTLSRWKENVAAGWVLRPPAFTYPDGRALDVHGRPF